MHRPITIAVLVATLLAAGAVGAQEEPKGVVAYRIAVMRTLGAQMMAVKTALTESLEFVDNVKWHAAVIEDAAKAMQAQLEDLFPKGSTENSRALPTIWQKWDDFAAATDRFVELAGEFRKVAEGDDDQAMLAAFAKLGKKGCGACHEGFRKKN